MGKYHKSNGEKDTSNMFLEAKRNFWEKLRLGNPNSSDSEIRDYLDSNESIPYSYLFDVLEDGGLKMKEPVIVETVKTKIVFKVKAKIKLKTDQLSLF